MSSSSAASLSINLTVPTQEIGIIPNSRPPKPTYLWVQDKGETQPKLCPIDTVEAKFNIIWFEGIRKPDGTITGAATPKLVQFYANHFALIHINDEVGWGVKTLKKIPSTSENILIFYGGEKILDKFPSDKTYLWTENHKPNLTLSEKENGLKSGETLAIDAKRYRNFAGFFQHYPTSQPDVLRRYIFWAKDNNEKAFTPLLQKIQYANIYPIVEHPHMLEIDPTIPAGSFIGWDYGTGYWADATPQLFSRDGQLLISPDDKNLYYLGKEIYRHVGKNPIKFDGEQIKKFCERPTPFLSTLLPSETGAYTGIYIAWTYLQVTKRLPWKSEPPCVMITIRDLNHFSQILTVVEQSLQKSTVASKCITSQSSSENKASQITLQEAYEIFAHVCIVSILETAFVALSRLNDLFTSNRMIENHFRLAKIEKTTRLHLETLYRSCKSETMHSAIHLETAATSSSLQLK